MIWETAWAELEVRADTHPLPDLSSLTARSRPSHRGRIGLAAAAVVTVAALAVVVAAWRGGGSSADVQPNHHNAAATPRHAARKPAADSGWTTLPTGHYLVLVDGIPGASIRSVIGVGNDKTLVQPDDTYQEVQVMGPPDGIVIKVNAPGGWSPSGGQQLTFEGRDAYYGTFLWHPEIPGHPVPPRVSLAWQYQPGAWATIGSLTKTPISLADAEHYAGLVKFAVGDPLPDPLPQDK